MTPQAIATAPVFSTPAVVRKERRGTDRLRVRGLWCDRGQVLDFSPRGMRLLTLRRWPEASIRKIALHVDDKVYEVDARCVWCRQDAMFTHAVGVAFDNLTPEVAEALEAVMANSHD